MGLREIGSWVKSIIPTPNVFYLLLLQWMFDTYYLDHLSEASKGYFSLSWFSIFREKVLPPKDADSFKIGNDKSQVKSKWTYINLAWMIAWISRQRPPRLDGTLANSSNIGMLLLKIFWLLFSFQSNSFYDWLSWH